MTLQYLHPLPIAYQNCDSLILKRENNMHFASSQYHSLPIRRRCSKVSSGYDPPKWSCVSVAPFIVHTFSKRIDALIHFYQGVPKWRNKYKQTPIRTRNKPQAPKMTNYDQKEPKKKYQPAPESIKKYKQITPKR